MKKQEVLTPGIQNVILFGNKVFAVVGSWVEVPVEQGVS